MYNLAVPTPEQLTRRRKQLRQQRRNRILQGSWQLLAAAGVLAGLVYAIRQPHWRVDRPDQIQVEGNRLLSPDQIRARLSLSYPIDLWHIQPDVLEQRLLQGSVVPPAPSPLRTVHVQRRLIPPGLHIQVEERVLVARSTVNGVAGLVDQEGTWLPLHSYPKLEQALPKLTLLGWTNHSPQDWATLLRQLRAISIHIQTVDWQKVDKLSLYTEIGRAYLGTFSDQLGSQLQALEQMRDLRRYCSCDPKDIDYIDLSSPKMPTLQLTPAAARRRWGSQPNP